MYIKIKKNSNYLRERKKESEAMFLFVFSLACANK